MADPKYIGDDSHAEVHVSVAVVKADGSVAVEAVREMVNVAADVICVANPRAGLAVKTLAVLGGWLWNSYKYDRVKPALQAVFERVERVSARQRSTEEAAEHFVEKQEFADLLEDALRRVADQPDPERRHTLRAILERIMDAPLEHAEHRLFLRLADETPAKFLRVLHATKEPVVRDEWMEPLPMRLARRTGFAPEGIESAMQYLAKMHLFDEFKFNEAGGVAGTLEYVLTPLGRDYLAFASAA